MREVRMSSALTTIYSAPESIIEDRLNEYLLACIKDINSWKTCGKEINDQLELHCFTSITKGSEVVLFENKMMKLFYCLNLKKAKLEVIITEPKVVKIFVNISRMRRLTDLSGKLKGRDYLFEICKNDVKKNTVLSTKLVVNEAVVVGDTKVILRLSEI